MKNEPAFPSQCLNWVERDEDGEGKYQTIVSSGGMTLRDYFAAKASEEDVREFQEWPPQTYGGRGIEPKYSRIQAKFRYADAMLKERSNEN